MTRETRVLPVVAAGAVETPFAIQGYDEVITRDTVWGEHSHPFHELLWNERGASTAVVGARVWTITPALGMWMPAGTLHSGSAVAGTWFRASFFGFHATPSISDTPVAVEITPLLRLLLERLGDQRLSAASRSTTEAMVLDALEPSPRELLVHAPTSALLRPIAEAFHENPGDQRTLADWAAVLGVSTRTITRAFHAETGTSFARWVASLRAQHAVALLTRGWEVEAVAEEVGYRSASAFGAAFRRTTGLTPGTFRAP
ncbi:MULTISPECIES: AraC family transcriptional regulator [Streptomyces]|uniref:AraC family transcriptional regulator n=1 Tax=Streptomyces lycii TaxID=2654337 RepID=A0ABQ7FMJ9_9ACTN|nr:MULTISPECIES: AraC family transcriptional regulator [Streptomyces]KAF4409198.1 AraC family transcriptional regulator [Streptomyces lycii]PGH47580.1 AraC family transcriptional regulator [Streptomyces sp. Ru87]